MRDIVAAVTVVGVGATNRFAGAWIARDGVLTPEQFGARGDGATNDTAAFAALADQINARGGGQVVLRETTYVVGRQRSRRGLGDGYAFEPDPILELVGCSAPLVIRGNGARIRCAGSLRYGTFDPRTGSPTYHELPFYDGREIASPYRWMIKVENCTGPVEITDLELDGNVAGLILGGPWGDSGYQLPAIGIALYNNAGPELVRNVHTHHHGLDGLYIDGIDRDRSVRSSISGVRSEYNGRQGCSIVGGRSYDFSDCRFNHTGRARVKSGPGAGVDIEAENKQVRDLTFANCEFANNRGVGLLADEGQSERAIFSDCTFVGATMWAAWPLMPFFRFDRCNFVGPIVNCFGDAETPARATQFHDCTFRDDPALSPSGQVYVAPRTHGPIADLPANPNVLFNRCRFMLTHRNTLPWTSNRVIFQNCIMSQRSPNMAYPRGIFVGRNRITGNVDLHGATVRGELRVNGVVRARTE